MDAKLDSDAAPSSTCPEGDAQDAGGEAKYTSADSAELKPVGTLSQKKLCTSETEASQTSTPFADEPENPVTTMEQAISTGFPEKVSSLLKSSAGPSAITKLLTGCYGGRNRQHAYGANGDRSNEADDNGLYRMTVPLLHAARTGNTSMFSTVYRAIQDNLTGAQAKRTLASKDKRSRSILAMAVASTSKAMLETVVAALEEHLTRDEVKKIMMAGHFDDTLLHRAAATGCKDIFEATRNTLESWLTQEKVEKLFHRELIQPITTPAAASGDKETWDAVMTWLHRSLGGAKKVKFTTFGMVQERDPWDVFFSGTVLLTAIRSGSIAVFKAVLDGLARHLTPEKRKEKLVNKRTMANVPSILHAAAEGGDKGMFGAVHAALNEGITPEEMEKMVGSHDAQSGRNILHYAASSGSKEMFETVLAIVKEDQVKSMMVPTFTAEDGVIVGVLHVASFSGNKDALEAVLSALENHLTPEEVKMAVSSTPTAKRIETNLRGLQTFKFVGKFDSKLEGCNVLHSAVLSGSAAVVQTVLASLDHDERKRMASIVDAVGQHDQSVGDAVPDGKDCIPVCVPVALRAKLFMSKRTAFDQVEVMIRSTGRYRQSILHSAAMSGDKEVFEATLGASVGCLPSQEVKDMMISEAAELVRLLGRTAVRSGNIKLAKAVIHEMGKEHVLHEKQIEGVISAAAQLGSVDMWEASVQAVESVRGALLKQTVRQHPLLVLKAGVSSEDPATVRAVYSFIRKLLPAEEASKIFSKFGAAGFFRWTHDGTVASEDVYAGQLWWAIEVLSCILEYPAVLDPKDIANLSRQASEEWMRVWFLETVASAKNPFLAGIMLSIALAEGATLAPEGERRQLHSTQTKVDNLLLEILEVLPQTVMGFPQGMTDCSAIFEPDVTVACTRGGLGPLQMILQSRRHLETFATQPLVVDLLSRRFTNGLPDLQDTRNVLAEEFQYLVDGGFRCPGLDDLDESEAENERKRVREIARARCLAIDAEDSHLKPTCLLAKGTILDALRSPSAMLQGVSIRYHKTSLSLLPGAQFIVAGLVSVPDAYYRVPAMRMALDFVVYLGILAVFSSVILLHDDGPLTTGDIVFAFYILGGAINEMREMTRGFSSYFADHWNPIDCLGLGLAAGGILVRLLGDGTSPWGWALYAMSSPLIFSRVLFFAQVLRFQGPMIQVIFGMLWELVKFGVVILVVMLGFAMSFYALFHEVDTFGQTFLMLFQGMLGEVGFFEDFMSDDYNEYEGIATALFVIYLVVIAIMLLNLLIAVLSTSHSKVQEKADQEFMVSRARLIDHYRLVVDKHLLPPPLNLAQLVLSLPLSMLDRAWHGPKSIRAKKAVGQFAFWLVVGSLAVVGGTVLWVVSTVLGPSAWHRHVVSRPSVEKLSHISVAMRYIIVVLWCLVGAPLHLAAFWLTAPLRWIGVRPWRWLYGRRDFSRLAVLESTPQSVESVLRYRPGGLGVGTLQEFLEDPMSDPKVREDEKSRPTTVEHMKQLRDRLEKTIETRLSKVEREVTASQEKLERIDERFDILMAVVHRRHAEGVDV